MVKASFFLMALLSLSVSMSATCYNICLGNGNYYIMYTDPQNPSNTTCELVGTGCEGGPWIHECPALVGPVDDLATETMLLLNPANFRPSTPEEHRMFVELLKRGKPEITYPDLSKLPRETIEWMRNH